MVILLSKYVKVKYNVSFLNNNTSEDYYHYFQEYKMYLLYLIAGAELSVVLQLVFVQTCGHLHNVMDLQFDDFSQRGEHTFWNDLQNLEARWQETVRDVDQIRVNIQYFKQKVQSQIKSFLQTFLT